MVNQTIELKKKIINVKNSEESEEQSGNLRTVREIKNGKESE